MSEEERQGQGAGERQPSPRAPLEWAAWVVVVLFAGAASIGEKPFRWVLAVGVIALVLLVLEARAERHGADTKRLSEWAVGLFTFNLFALGYYYAEVLNRPDNQPKVRAFVALGIALIIAAAVRSSLRGRAAVRRRLARGAAEAALGTRVRRLEAAVQELVDRPADEAAAKPARPLLVGWARARSRVIKVLSGI